MIIYNVTVKIDWSIHEDWVRWMKEDFIPGMLATNLFYEYQMVRLLEVEEEEGPTYAIQYYARHKEDYLRFVNTLSYSQSEKATRKWGNRFVTFSTLMQVVN